MGATGTYPVDALARASLSALEGRPRLRTEPAGDTIGGLATIGARVEYPLGAGRGWILRGRLKGAADGGGSGCGAWRVVGCCCSTGLMASRFGIGSLRSSMDLRFR